MKKILKIICAVVVVMVILVAVFALLLIWLSKQPAVKENYFENVKSEEPMERKYTAKGSFDVSFVEYDADSTKVGKYEIWYPSNIADDDGAYPVVIMANGTGVKASRYKPIFDHLASWGFIVVGNEDESSWDGVSSSKSLDFILGCNDDPDSVFYQRIDTSNIGIAGHSQGGVGAINAVTSQENGNCYKAIYTASTPHLELAKALGWSYDVSNIAIPYFMTAGTLKVDAGDGNDSGICPLTSLQDNYDKLSDDIMKIYARRVDTDHGDMLANADGYMTAWFMYQLKSDEDAGTVFIGEDAEISNNSNWQDVTKNR